MIIHKVFHLKDLLHIIQTTSERTKNIDIYTKLEHFVDKYCELHGDMCEINKDKIKNLRKLIENQNEFT